MPVTTKPDEPPMLTSGPTVATLVSTAVAVSPAGLPATLNEAVGATLQSIATVLGVTVSGPGTWQLLLSPSSLRRARSRVPGVPGVPEPPGVIVVGQHELFP